MLRVCFFLMFSALLLINPSHCSAQQGFIAYPQQQDGQLETGVRQPLQPQEQSPELKQQEKQLQTKPRPRLQSAVDRKLEINLADKRNLNLQALVKWLAEEKGLELVTASQKFSSATSTKIVFYGDVRVDSEALLDVVQSILRTNGFAIVKSDVVGLYQVVELPEVRSFTPLVEAGEETRYPPAEYITGIFPLSHINQQDATAYVKQLLFGRSQAESSSNITGIANQNVLVITDTAARVRRIAGLLKKIDIPGEVTARKFYQVKHLEAQELKMQLAAIFGEAAATDSLSDRQRGNNSGTVSRTTPVKLDVVLRTNQLLISGTNAQIDDALNLAEALDVEDKLELRTYLFQHVSPAQVDEMVRESFAPMQEGEVNRLYKSTVNVQTNSLVVTTRPEIHERVDGLKKQLDVESTGSAAQSPIRFYTLKNVKAIDILETLQSVESRFLEDRQPETNQRLSGINSPNEIGRFGPDGRGGQALAGGSDVRLDPFAEQRQREERLLLAQRSVPQTGGNLISDLVDFASDLSQPGQIIPGNAQVTIDEATNTLIVVAEPSIQQLYKDLIERLDVRRPQVLIEATVISISEDDTYSFGIDIAGGDRTGARTLFGLTNLGVGVPGVDGNIAFAPGLGFNGVLIDPSTADVLLQALAQHNKARVISAPRILVNDNSTGTLSSVQEIPFVGTNAGNVVSSTSLGGFAQAGTTLSVTPQISDDDYLNLEFDILVNNFLGAPVDGAVVPPARATDQVTSEISIPDGHTVIVGGLKTTQLTDDLTGIPIIENIPILRLLGSNHIDTTSDSRLYVFIKPTILRDDKFRDLRFLSKLERREAKINDDFPSSEPVLVR